MIRVAPYVVGRKRPSNDTKDCHVSCGHRALRIAVVCNLKSSFAPKWRSLRAIEPWTVGF